MKDEKKSHGAVDKSNRNNSFINRMQLPLLCEKSGAILLVLVVLTAGRPAGRLNTSRLEKFKFSTDRTVRIFTEYIKKERCYYRVTNVFRLVFSDKVCVL